jgi:hypothetical protein
MKLVFGCVLAAIAMFVWGAVFWMSPFPVSTLARTADDVAAGKALLEHFPVSGTYFIPGHYNDPGKIAELSAAGPIATVHLLREGRPMMDPRLLVQGFLHGLMSVFLLALLLQLALPGLGSYGARVGFTLLAGLAAAIFINLGDPIWWYQSWGWHLYRALYTVSAWLVAGLVLAAFVKPSRMILRR